MKRSYLLPSMISSATLFLATALFAESDQNEPRQGAKMSAGAVEIDALRAAQSKRLHKLDTDGDGNVSREEFLEGVRSRERDLTVDVDIEDFIAGEGVDRERIRAIRKLVESRVENGLSELAPKAKGRIIIQKSEGDDAEVDIDLGFDSGAPWRDFGRGVNFRSAIDPSEWFDIVDANEDGVLDRDEVAGARERIRDHGISQRFDMLDVNKDGQLNDEDIDARLEKLRALDEDGDGTVSRRELGELLRLLGEKSVHDQVHVMRSRREHGDR